MPNDVDIARAYVLGLFIGGGTIRGDKFQIVLPFRAWGTDPERMGQISKDIVKTVGGRFRKAFGIDITFKPQARQWVILPTGEQSLKELLETLRAWGLPTAGFLLAKADLTKAKGCVKGIVAENFLTGIFDARASLTKTHRRFTKKHPVVSIEVPGSTQNFNFVMQLCSWLTALGSVTDQVLYNHPCQSSGADPTYPGWKKGFKIRFLMRSFLAKYSFALKAKAFDATTLRDRQAAEEQKPCLKRVPSKVRPVAIHADIASPELPEEVRSKLFFHYLHICAVLGCPYAPEKAITRLVRGSENLVCLAPVCTKGDSKRVTNQYDTVLRGLFSGYTRTSSVMSVKMAMKCCPRDRYPGITGALAFLFASKVAGHRHKGGAKKIIEAATLREVTLHTLKGVQGGPIMLENETVKRAAIVGAVGTSAMKEPFSRAIEVKGLVVRVR